MSIEKDCFVVKSQKFSVVETLEEIINIKNYYNRKKAVEILLFCEGTSGANKVQGDSERIQLVIFKILQLSIDQTKPNSRVKLICRCLDSKSGVYLSIQVKWKKHSGTDTID